MRKPKTARVIKAPRVRNKQWHALLKNDELGNDIRLLQGQYGLPVAQGAWIDQYDHANNQYTKGNAEPLRKRVQLNKDIDALRANHGLNDEWARDLWGHIVLINTYPSSHPRDTMLPEVRIGFRNRRYDIVIGPSVDIDDPLVIADIKHHQEKAREFYGMRKSPEPVQDKDNPRRKDWTPVLRYRLLTGATYRQIADDLGYNTKYVTRKIQVLEREL